MFDALLRRQYSQLFYSFNCAFQKLTYCSSLVSSELRLKALIESDRKREKQKFKHNFVENLFINKFQESILEYPQIDSLKEVKTLNKQRDFIQEILTIASENEEITSERDSEKVIATIKKLDLTGFKLSHLINGYGYLESEYMYMLETLSLNPALCKAIAENEDFGIQLIDLFGNDIQKKTYLPKLGSGESLTCFAHLESEPLVSLNPVSANTTAVLSSDGQSYIVSGKKNWVYNASFADVMIFSASVQDKDEKKLTLFVINKNSDGVKVSEPIPTLGMRGLDICEVTFDNVVVPVTSTLGNVLEGDKIINKVLANGKLNNGAVCISLIKRLINTAVNHCIHNKMINKFKYERNFFQEKIGYLVSRLYALESATYLVAGRKDSFEKSDVFLESLIVKIYASETLQYVLHETLAILGTKAFDHYNGLDELLKDSQFFPVCDVTNDYLRLVLSHIGCKHVVNYKAKTSTYTKALSAISKRNWEHIIVPGDKYRIYSGDTLKGYLHLVFERESRIAEDAVGILKDTTNFLHKKYKEKIFERHYELRVLADILINVYVLTATLGRASRAYCLSVKLQEVDKLVTHSEVLRLYHTIKKLQIFLTEPKFNLEDLDKLRDKVLDSTSFKEDYPVLKNLLVKQSS